LLKLEGFHFRRQVPIAEYVGDFACHRARLIVELDGGQHNETHGLAHDAIRSAVLQRLGFTVLRFWNHEILEDVAAVMDQIRLALPLSIDLARMDRDDPHP